MAGCALFGIGPKPAESQPEQAEEPAEPPGPNPDPYFTRPTPKWMHYDGTVDAEYIYATVVNHCKKTMRVRLTAQTSEGPGCADGSCEENLEPWFDEYTFYNQMGPKAKSALPPIEQFWIRDTEKLGQANFWIKVYDARNHDSPWTKQEQLELKFGERYALEIKKDCKTLAVRPPEQRLHKCYKWLYSAACGVDTQTAMEPAPEPVVPCADGTVLSVEGDPTNPVCKFENERGFCRITAATMDDQCARR